MKNKVPNSIAQKRKDRGLSQAVLADKLGITVTQLSRLETGKSSLTQHRMQTIADALGVRPAELYHLETQHGDIRLDAMHKIIQQLDELLLRLDITITPEQRADISIQFYTLELDRIDTTGRTVDDIDLRRYEQMVKALAV